MDILERLAEKYLSVQDGKKGSEAQVRYVEDVIYYAKYFEVSLPQIQSSIDKINNI